MSIRLSPRLLFGVLFAAAMALPLMGAQVRGESQTDTKIRLMSEALRARDAGDVAGAQKALAELSKLVGNDPAAQRLRAEIETQAAANRVAKEQRAAAERAAEQAAIDAAQRLAAARAAMTAPPVTAPVAVAPPPASPAPRALVPANAGPTTIEVKIPEPSRSARPSLEQEAEAIARAEAIRIATLMSRAETELAAARAQIRAGRLADGIATVDAALGPLPLNPLTRQLIVDLKKEKAVALLDQAQAALRRGDVAAANTILAAHRELVSAGPWIGESGRALPIPAVSGPVTVAFPDPGSAAARAAATQDMENAVAREVARRMTEEKAAGAAEREKARAQLLEEVTKGWQRPGRYQERPRDAGEAAALAPLEKKLNEITLPRVSFTRAEIGQVVAALGAASEEFDSATTGAKGVNIVLLDPGHKNPPVTIALRNATLRRVLDFVTESIGYQYEIQADAVVVRPGGETTNLETRFFPVTRATVLRMTGITGGGARNPRDPAAAGGAGNTEGTTSGGEAAAMKNFLQQAGVSFAAEGASLAYDGSAIIVTQTSRNLERVRNILARYRDIRQVEIEAKFMEVQEGALEELGVTWNLSRRGVPQIDPATGAPVLDANGRQVFVPRETYSSGGVARPLPDAFPGTSNSRAITIRDTTGAGFSVPVAPTAVPGGVQLATTADAVGRISGLVGEFDVAAVVRALAQKQGTDLLSSPKVTVLSGHPANITVAQELRYPQSYGEMQSQVGSGSGAGTGLSAAGVTITAGTPQEFATRNIGVELKVTPTVEEDDYSISLDLNPRVTEFEGFVEYGGPSIAISSGVTVTVPPGFYQPIFSVRDIATKVTIWDGATLVMGGLTREEVKKVDDKVPILGDIPFIGRLFRSKGESTQKRNLLIFVTANLVSPGGSPKKQSLSDTPAGSVFQNPHVVTPAGTEPRAQPAGK